VLSRSWQRNLLTVMEADNDRGLGKANLPRAFGMARSMVPALASFLIASLFAGAQNGTPAARPGSQFSFMQLPGDNGLHDINNEGRNAYRPLTYASSWKPSLQAPYTNLNGGIHSLLPTVDRTLTRQELHLESTQKDTVTATNFFSLPDGFTFSASEPPKLASRYNYLVPSRFLNEC
jgi:hypothetical protein